MAPALSLIALVSAVLFSVCDAADYCPSDDIWSSSGQYCAYGCCGYGNRDCCGGNVGLIVGLCVGAGVLIFVIIIIICVCRRRRYRGLVYRNQPATMVVSQSTVTTQAGVVTTSGVQPGVTYPPYQPYAPYPNYGYPAAPSYPPATSSGYPPTSPPGYPPTSQAQDYGHPPQPMPYAAGPPSYDSLQPAAGGVTNQGFDNK